MKNVKIDIFINSVRDDMFHGLNALGRVFGRRSEIVYRNALIGGFLVMGGAALLFRLSVKKRALIIAHPGGLGKRDTVSKGVFYLVHGLVRLSDKLLEVRGVFWNGGDSKAGRELDIQ